MRRKSILITGSSSIVAGYIAKHLSHDCNITFAGRSGADCFLDLENPDLRLFEGKKFDYIIHAAADFGGENFEDYVRCEKVNTLGTLSICRLAEIVKAKHVTVLSSISASFSAEDPGYNIYSLTKRNADDLASLYCKEKNIDLLILRPTQIYDSQTLCQNHQRFLYAIITDAWKGNDVLLYGSKNVVRNYLHVDDLCHILKKSLDTHVTGIYQCAHQESPDIQFIAKSALECFKSQKSVLFLKDKPDLLDTYKNFRFNDTLYKRIGFQPSICIRDGIERIRESGTIS